MCVSVLNKSASVFTCVCNRFVNKHVAWFVEKATFDHSQKPPKDGNILRKILQTGCCTIG